MKEAQKKNVLSQNRHNKRFENVNVLSHMRKKTDVRKKFSNEFLRWANSCFENSSDIEEYGAIAGKLSNQ